MGASAREISMRVRRCGSILLGVAAALALGAVSSPSAMAEVPCRDVRVPVSVGGSNAEIAGLLCGYGDLAGRTIEVLVPGYTYNRAYWDFPFESPKYSFVDALTQAGYATLALDRLGTGQSSHPSVSKLTFDNEVSVIRQVVDAVRGGDVAGTRFGKIVLVGHSLGSGIAAADVVEYDNVDALELTGFSHTLDATGLGSFFAADIYPVQSVPWLRDDPPGYVTTVPGGRASLFYGASGTYDPAVAQYDDATRDASGNAIEAVGIGLPIAFATSGISVPVLVVAGAQDTIVCGTPLCMSAERSFYPAAKSIDTVSVSNTGHDLNLSYSAPTFFADSVRWANQAVGSGR